MVIGLILTVIGISAASMATTWSTGTNGNGSVAADHPSVTSGVVKDVDPATCQDGASACATAHTSVDWQTDLVPVAIPANVLSSHTLTEGDRIRFAIEDGELDSAEFTDFQRHMPMTALLVVACAAVIVVAAWRGTRALVGIAATLAVVWAYVAPALLNGSPPLQVVLTASAAIITISLVMVSGLNLRTGSALLGAYASLGVMTLAAAWATRSTRPVSGGSDATATLAQLGEIDVTVSDLLMCGLVIAGLGLLIEIARTQSSAVWNLRASAPDSGGVRLFMTGMQAGRERITSTVYVLTLAYVGAALPAVVLVVLTGNDPAVALSGNELGSLIVRALVATASLALAIPVVTAVAALVAATSVDRR